MSNIIILICVIFLITGWSCYSYEVPKMKQEISNITNYQVDRATDDIVGIISFKRVDKAAMIIERLDILIAYEEYAHGSLPKQYKSRKGEHK